MKKIEKNARNYNFTSVSNIALGLQQWLHVINFAMDVNIYKVTKNSVCDCSASIKVCSHKLITDSFVHTCIETST